MRAIILGGTGTLGSALAKEILVRDPTAIVNIVSRDEHKQAQMRLALPECRFTIANICIPRSLERVFDGVDVVFHTAALKHVLSGEAFPIQTLYTNTIAVDEMANLAIKARVPRYVFFTTDKAVDPHNVYGCSKMISERIVSNYNLSQDVTKFITYRWGNVLGSQGSAIPLFIKSLREQGRVYLTSAEMTRFWISIESAVDYVLSSYLTAEGSRTLVPLNLRSAPLVDVVRVLAQILDIKHYQTQLIPIGSGEKLHEVMYSPHDGPALDSSNCEQLTDDELVSLLTPIISNVLGGKQ